jgi:hypothetical protein
MNRVRSRDARVPEKKALARKSPGITDSDRITQQMPGGVGASRLGPIPVPDRAHIRIGSHNQVQLSALHDFMMRDPGPVFIRTI